MLAVGFTPATAAIVFDFTNSSNTFNPGTLTVSSLVDGTPTDTGDQLTSRTTITGSLTGVTDNSASFDIVYDAFTNSTLSGNDITVSGSDVLASNASGIAIRNGDINPTNGRGISFTFDFTNFAVNTNLRITGITATSTGGSGHDVQLVVDNSSVTTLGGLTGSGLSIDISDGDFLFFRNVGTAGSAFRVTTLTMEAVVPEPSAMLLGGLGSLLLLRRRRH